MPTSNLLEVRDLSVTYGGSVLALHGVDMDVPEGGCVALLGANGAGKTTVLRAITGTLRQYDGAIKSGSIAFQGDKLGRRDTPTLVQAGIAQTLEGRHIFAELTVAENLKIGSFAKRGRATEKQTYADVLKLFPRLNERQNQRGGLLSGGEQQMLAIGRALMAAPKLLVLDEPSLGLAPLIVQEIGEALKVINQQGTAIILVDQGTALALAVTDHAYLLEVGQMRTNGPTRELLANDEVRESYLGTTAGAGMLETALR